jgi:Tol biopolymer transport system component
MSHLPGNLIFVRDGNLFELKRGGQLDQLTGTADASMPAPSPDGRSVAFVRFGKYWSDLWVLDLRTSHRYAVTRDKNDREIRNSMWAAWPTWQPGNQLVFSWDNAKLSTPPSDARPTDLALWEMPTLGGTAARVSTPVLGGGGGDTQSVGRPGHSQVAYVTWNFNPQNNQPYSQLVLLDLTTRQTTYLTPPRGRVLEPAWDPSGKRLTFVRNGPHGDEVVVASLIGARHGLTLGPSTVIASGQVAQPAFTPDGKWVSYLRMDGNGASLYLIPSIGGPSQELTVMTGHLDPWSHPFWTR